MSELTPEERRKIYEEERARLAAQPKPEKKKTKPATLGCLILIILFSIVIYNAFFKSSSKETTTSKREQTTQTKYTAPAKPLFIAYENANIRSTPSTSGEIIGKLEKYETIRVDGYEKEWLKITKAGKTGYVSESLLKKADYPLHVKINKFTVGEYNYFEVVGEVINVSLDTYKFVEVKAVFYDKGKNIVGTDTTYACATDHILPGRVKPFKFMGENQPDYKSVAVTIDHFTKVE